MKQATRKGTRSDRRLKGQPNLTNSSKPGQWVLLKFRRVIDINSTQVRVQLRGGATEDTLIWLSRCGCREMGKTTMRVERGVLEKAMKMGVKRPNSTSLIEQMDSDE